MGKKKKTQVSTSRVLRNRNIGVDENGKNTESESSDSSPEIESRKEEQINIVNPKIVLTEEYVTRNFDGQGHVDNVKKGDNTDNVIHTVVEESLDGSIHSDYESEFPRIPGDRGKNTEPDMGEQPEYEEKTPSPPGKSYLSAAGASNAKKKVNFRYIESEKHDGVDVVIPIESVLEASDRYKHTLYGYFLGQRLPFPVVKYYVMNTWKKFGIEKMMMNAKGFYFFKFESEQGMLDVMEGGPWMIRNSPIILNTWSPDVSLSKEDLTRAPIWVKLFDIPLAAYTEVGLSVIASKIGKPIMLDSYTTTMCVESWGRPNFARAMIEVGAELGLKDRLTVGIPNRLTNNTTIDEIRIEYEWKPPRCSCCKVFGHRDAQCPKAVPVDANTVVKINDGFIQVTNKNIGKKNGAAGIILNNAKSKFVYRPKNKNGADISKPSTTNAGRKKVTNPFEVLNSCNEEDKEIKLQTEKDQDQMEVEPGNDEMAKFMASKKYSEGASTPGLDGFNGFVVRYSRDGTGLQIAASVIELMILAVSDQAIHCQVRSIEDDQNFFISFIYAANQYAQRRPLWRELEMHNRFINGNPWIMMGDFNVSLTLEDSSMGSSKITIAMREFQECVDKVHMVDVNHSGFHYTWNQRPNAEVGLLKKIDRVMANDSFIDKFTDAYVLFQAYRTSDHCPAILKFAQNHKNKPKPFKFSNYITEHKKFKETVTEGWKVDFQGHMMFRITKRLRLLKKEVRKLMWSKGNLHENVINLRKDLDEVQAKLDKNPESREVRKQESITLRKYNDAIYEEECFLKQKSKIEWLRVGDSNSRYFHNVVKGRNHRGKIHAIQNPEGTIVEGREVCTIITHHFKKFLGSRMTGSPIVNPSTLFTKRIGTDTAAKMVTEVTTEEIRRAIFDINDSKSPGPDGYSAAFFKQAWDIIGDDVVQAVKDFFHNGRLLKEINHTIISLIPKVQTPTKVTEFRPISCCNVLYKCISKVISNRIKISLDEIVSDNQLAFVPGRRISDNILLTQEIMKNYHLNRGVPRCAFKVDIQKAYDTVDWGFLKKCLVGFGYPHKMVKWIMRCVSTASYSININGDLHDYFPGKRGLRQGDPLSPYLFTLIMEALSLMLIRRASNGDDFRYHPKCEQLKLINLCFADDLFLFAAADLNSVEVIRDALEEFKACSGLTLSLPKSTAFFANVYNVLKEAILNLLPFEEGQLPVRYLGVPLVSSRLMYRDCKILVERVKRKIEDWKNKFLSFAGRVQLIISVLTSMQVYWASVFILPVAIIKDIEKLLRGFLWCQGEMKRGKAKVKWDDLCLPKEEGGLGLKRLKYWNIALITTHIWSILTQKESLWVKWVHAYRIGNYSFWDAPIRPDASWSWRKLLNCRDIIRKHMVYNIGDGAKALAWFDKWNNIGPLTDIISWRDINAAGFYRYARVKDLILDKSWKWPHNWHVKYPVLNSIQVPVISEKCDELQWQHTEGILHQFSVRQAYEAIRPAGSIVPWFEVVWHSNSIPRHSFLLWLLMKQKLKTQDNLKTWEIRQGQVLECPLCFECQDSHSHLFFGCRYSRVVWEYVKQYAHGLRSHDWSKVVDDIAGSNDKNSANTLVAKLLFAAAVYFIWIERNSRLFDSKKRSAKDLFGEIYASVRLKLFSVRFKETRNIKLFKIAWILE
ncbi:uncharacterized protein [Rutidosis leptorrhynchoides]|uniref:uncharacterized protein n=1 Tax=Rutidosis leptorrhynchoides TaxID=125765 RepID=UPI003A99952A